jgi:hypothetical protein
MAVITPSVGVWFARENRGWSTFEVRCVDYEILIFDGAAEQDN